MPSLSVTRRAFVANATIASLSPTGTLLGTRRGVAQSSTQGITSSYFRRLTVTTLSSSQLAESLFPTPVPPLALRELATCAIDAAMHAGATYADVRIGERHQLLLQWYFVNETVRLTSTLTYGIRVLVDGAWAFVHGSIPTVDAMTTSARDAVAMAKGYAPLVLQRAELAPAPVVTGEWATPMQEDPFLVPLRDHGAMMGTYYELVQRVPRAYLQFWPGFTWTKETRVFASSEGSRTTQLLRGVDPRLDVMVRNPFTEVRFRFPQLIAAAGGYEVLADPTRYEDAFLALVEEADRYVRLPRQTLTVGRYPLVVNGSTVGLLFGQTIGAGLELDRVVGEEAGASGTSYLAPPLEMLGSQIANPQLTATATRALPTSGAVRWDDEGVEPHDYPVLTNGRLMNYHTSRWTAPVLKDWYARQGQPLYSHGCAMVADAAEPLAVRAPHLTMAANPTSARLETLCRDIREGVLVLGIQEYTPDQQFASGNLHAKTREGPTVGVMLKLNRGQIVSRIVGNSLDLSTKRFWKEQLVALGDASTVQPTDFEVRKGMPWRRALQSTTAPAALFRDVNVIAQPPQR